jgi:hypothetical protein
MTLDFPDYMGNFIPRGSRKTSAFNSYTVLDQLGVPYCFFSIQISLVRQLTRLAPMKFTRFWPLKALSAPLSEPEDRARHP